MLAVHSQNGRHFLGLRRERRGGYEIVYDGGPNARRFVRRLKLSENETAKVDQHIHTAIRASDVLSTLYSGLRSEEIDFEIEDDYAGA